jgi:hypothetical protein
VREKELPKIFETVIAQCKGQYPDHNWEMEEKEVSRSSIVYKLIGEAHGVRTFEPINRMMDDKYILELACFHAKTIVDRIKRVSKGHHKK